MQLLPTLFEGVHANFRPKALDRSRSTSLNLLLPQDQITESNGSIQEVSDLPNSKPPADKITDQHLVYLKDPLKLADFIRKTLRDGDFETAQKIVRAASKDVQCIVSWNHLVDWQVTQGKLNAAIKTYNEVCMIGDSQAILVTNKVPDEETCTTSRCSYLHHTFQWRRRKG